MHLKSVTCHPDQYPTRDHYPFNLPVFQRTTELTFDTPVTMFVGENGTGKSTLLDALVHKCGIHVWRDETRHRVEHNPYEDKFPEHISIEWTDGQTPGSFFSASVFQDFAEILDDWAAVDPGQLKHFGGKSLVTQSHGQSIMSYLTTRYKIKGLYLLDEPEAALSPKTQIELLKVFESMSEDGHAQFIIATHSPILLSCRGATIYSFDREPIAPVSYKDTDHYQLYKRFLDGVKR